MKRTLFAFAFSVCGLLVGSTAMAQGFGRYGNHYVPGSEYYNSQYQPRLQVVQPGYGRPGLNYDRYDDFDCPLDRQRNRREFRCGTPDYYGGEFNQRNRLDPFDRRGLQGRRGNVRPDDFHNHDSHGDRNGFNNGNPLLGPGEVQVRGRNGIDFGNNVPRRNQRPDLNGFGQQNQFQNPTGFQNPNEFQDPNLLPRRGNIRNQNQFPPQGNFNGQRNQQPQGFVNQFGQPLPGNTSGPLFP